MIYSWLVLKLRGTSVSFSLFVFFSQMMFASSTFLCILRIPIPIGVPRIALGIVASPKGTCSALLYLQKEVQIISFCCIPTTAVM